MNLLGDIIVIRCTDGQQLCCCEYTKDDDIVCYWQTSFVNPTPHNISMIIMDMTGLLGIDIVGQVKEFIDNII